MIIILPDFRSDLAEVKKTLGCNNRFRGMDTLSEGVGWGRGGRGGNSDKSGFVPF